MKHDNKRKIVFSFRTLKNKIIVLIVFKIVQIGMLLLETHFKKKL